VKVQQDSLDVVRVKQKLLRGRLADPLLAQDYVKIPVRDGDDGGCGGKRLRVRIAEPHTRTNAFSPPPSLLLSLPYLLPPSLTNSSYPTYLSLPLLLLQSFSLTSVGSQLPVSSKSLSNTSY
jgi:hypothetical protein